MSETNTPREYVAAIKGVLMETALTLLHAQELVEDLVSHVNRLASEKEES